MAGTCGIYFDILYIYLNSGISAELRYQGLVAIHADLRHFLYMRKFELQCKQTFRGRFSVGPMYVLLTAFVYNAIIALRMKTIGKYEPFCHLSVKLEVNFGKFL